MRNDESQIQALLEGILAGLPEAEQPFLIGQLAAHWALVCQWNDRCNLTAISQPEDAAWLHYRDSLQALPLLTSGPILDIGSGAGFPGIPLALARPEWSFTLLEPRHKRASFLQTVISRLGMRNVRVVIGRSDQPIPQLSPDQGPPYAAVVTRATFSGEADLLGCMRWLRPGGKLIAYRSESAYAGQVADVMGENDRFNVDKNDGDQRTSLAQGGCQLYAYTLRTTHRALAVWTKS